MLDWLCNALGVKPRQAAEEMQRAQLSENPVVTSALLHPSASRLGYLLFTVSANSVKGAFVYVDTVKSSPCTAAAGKSITVQASGKVDVA